MESLEIKIEFFIGRKDMLENEKIGSDGKYRLGGRNVSPVYIEMIEFAIIDDR